MAMSFTFSDEEFASVLAQWASLKDTLDEQARTYENLRFWADQPPAQDTESHGFMVTARDALRAADVFGERARAYVDEFHGKLVNVRKDYLEADEDGVRRFQITLDEGDQS